MKSYFPLVIVLIILLALNLHGKKSALTFKIGQFAPDLFLPSYEDGKPMSLKQFIGQKVILHIWASW